MGQYVIRRLILLIPTLWIVATLTFIVMHLIPGDAVLTRLGEGTAVTPAQIQQLRQYLGIDRPVPVQYLSWLWGLLHLDFGRSLVTQLPVIWTIRAAFPVTLELVILSQIFGLAIAIPVGVTSAIKQDSWIDYVLRVLNISLIAAPGFWIGTMVIVLAAIWFRWAPPLGYAKIWVDPVKNLKQFLFPAAVAGFTGTGTLMRLTRSAVLEVLRQDYVRTAHAKGLAHRVVLVRHVLRNAMIPVITLWGGSIGGQLGGAIITETIFNLPGIGLATIGAIQNYDVPMVEVTTVIFGFVVVFMNLLVDLSYTLLDRRVTYT